MTIVRNIVATIFINLMAFSSFSLAADTYEFWPGSDYDPAIPTVEQVLGYQTGEKITSPRDMIRYFEALEQAAPNRIKLTDYAKSWQGRRLIYAAISSSKNIAELPALRQDMQQLADPRKIDQATAKSPDQGFTRNRMVSVRRARR